MLSVQNEGIWKHLKYVELKNVCCQSLAELKVELRKAKERLRHKRDIILTGYTSRTARSRPYRWRSTLANWLRRVTLRTGASQSSRTPLWRTSENSPSRYFGE